MKSKVIDKISSLIRGRDEEMPEYFHELDIIGRISGRDFERICRANSQSVYLGNKTVLARVLTRYFVYADAEDIGITPHFCLNGYWESWISQCFARVVKKGWHCVDIGANQGYFSLLLSGLIGTEGRLAAVEPNPKLCEFLSKNLEVNGFQSSSQVIQRAVSAIPNQPIYLLIPHLRALNSEISAAPSDDADADSVKVLTTTVDDLCRDWKRVDFIKIDAEGAEEQIWHGMQETIARYSNLTVVMEVNRSRYNEPRKFLERIVADGFRLAHIGYDSYIKPLTMEQYLRERPNEDWMLFLQK